MILYKMIVSFLLVYKYMYVLIRINIYQHIYSQNCSTTEDFTAGFFSSPKSQQINDHY